MGFLYPSHSHHTCPYFALSHLTPYIIFLMSNSYTLYLSFFLPYLYSRVPHPDCIFSGEEKSMWVGYKMQVIFAHNVDNITKKEYTRKIQLQIIILNTSALSYSKFIHCSHLSTFFILNTTIIHFSISLNFILKWLCP